MEINLKVIQVLPLQSGVGKNSGKQWSSQSFIGETMEQYSRKVCLEVFNPGQNVAIPNVGDTVTASFDLESRSFMSKDGREMYSTTVRCWKLVPYDPTANAQSFDPQQPAPQQTYAPQQQPYQQPQQQAYAPQGQYTQQQAPQFAAPQYQAPQQPQPQAGMDSLPF